MGPIRRAADRLWDGSAIIGRCYAAGLADWVRDGERTWHRWLRLGILLGVAYLGWRLVRAVPALMWFLVGWWCVAAYRAARPERHAVENATEDEDDDDEDEELDADTGMDPLLALCWRLIGDSRGVHLNALGDALREAGVTTPTDNARLRTELATRGVPTRAKVRAPKGAVPGAPEGVTRGVHRDDLQAVTGPPPRPLSEHPQGA